MPKSGESESALMAKKKQNPTPDEERPSVREIPGATGGHREYKIGGVTYVVDGRYAERKSDGADKTFGDRIEDFIGSEFAELNAHRAAGKER